MNVGTREKGRNIILALLVSFIKWVTSINHYVGVVLSYSIGVLTILVLVEVFLRYVLNSPTSWNFDVSLWLFGIPAALGGGYVLAQKGHVNMDIFYSKASARRKAILDSITAILFFAFVGILVWQGLRFVTEAITANEHSISTWRVVIWPLKIFLPLAAILLLLQGIAQFIQNLYLAVTGRNLQ